MTHFSVLPLPPTHLRNPLPDKYSGVEEYLGVFLRYGGGTEQLLVDGGGGGARAVEHLGGELLLRERGWRGWRESEGGGSNGCGEAGGKAVEHLRGELQLGEHLGGGGITAAGEGKGGPDITAREGRIKEQGVGTKSVNTVH